MSDFTVPQELPPINPFLLQQSQLVKAAVRLNTVDSAQDAQKKHFALSTSQINSLLSRYKVSELTYEALMQLPTANLAPNEREFIRSLQNSPALFHQLAALDQHPESLSVQDLKIASQLAGDSLVLTDDDLEYLQNSRPAWKPSPTPSSTPTHPAQREEHHYDIDDLSHLLQKIAPEGLHFDELQELPMPPHLSAEEQETFHFLKSRAVQKILYNVAQSNNGLLTIDALRVLVSLIWNPTILGAVPIVFMKSPLFDEHEIDVPAVAEAAPIRVENDEHINNAFKLRKQIKLKASRLQALIHQIDPKTDHVTLAQLRSYQPKTREEAELLNMLKQSSIFKALAGQDHEPDTLSPNDVKLVMKHGALFLQDPYLMLVITP